MNRNRYGRSVVLFVTMICLLTAVAYGQRSRITVLDNKWKKDFVLKGIVETVDANAKSVTVSGENIPGWLNSTLRSGFPPMVLRMTHGVYDPDVLKTEKRGDRVTAKVYEG